MAIRFAANLSLSCLVSISLLGSAEPAFAQAQSANQVQKTISSKARSIGARAQRAGNAASIVTYRGRPRDFVKCRTKGGKSITGYALDSRTTVQLSGRKARAKTLYLVTAKFRNRGKTGAQSVAFTRSGVGKFDNGVTCRATGKLERLLLGS